MAKEGFFEKIQNQLGIEKGDKILHIYNKKTNFSKFFSDSVGEKGKVYAIDTGSIRKKDPKRNIQFATLRDNLNLETGTIGILFIEDSIYFLTDFYDSLSGIKKYLTEKGKIAINQKNELIPLHLKKRRKLKEGMYTAGFRIKNKIMLNNGSHLDIFERE